MRHIAVEEAGNLARAGEARTYGQNVRTAIIERHRLNVLTVDDLPETSG